MLKLVYNVFILNYPYNYYYWKSFKMCFIFSDFCCVNAYNNILNSTMLISFTRLLFEQSSYVYNNVLQNTLVLRVFYIIM